MKYREVKLYSFCPTFKTYNNITLQNVNRIQLINFYKLFIMFRSIINYLEAGEFTYRIKRRHSLLWREAQPLKKTLLTRNHSLDDWRDEELWQRRLSNKLNAKEFASLNGCKTADLYWKGRDVENINFSSLPAHYVIRPARGCGSIGVFVMQHGVNLFDKKTYSPQQIVRALQQQVNKNPEQFMLVEEFLQNEDGEYKILDDYKFFCFNGKIASVGVINRLGPETGFVNYFDEHWNPMESIATPYPYPIRPGQKKPKCFDEMVEQVKMLSKLYRIFVRLDFYATSKGAVFGEFTPTPNLGLGYTKYGHNLLVNYWDKYCKGQI